MILSKKFLLLAGTALLAPIVSSAETDNVGYRQSDGEKTLAGGNFYGTNPLGSDSGTYVSNLISAWGDSDVSCSDVSWDSSKNALLSDGEYVGVDTLFVLSDDATFTNTGAFELVSKSLSEGVEQLNSDVYYFENYAILFDGSVFKNEGTFSYEPHASYYDEEGDDAATAKFFLTGTSRFENAGTVDGSFKYEYDGGTGYGYEHLLFRLYNSSSFVNLETGYLSSFPIALHDNSIFENRGTLAPNFVWISIDDNARVINNGTLGAPGRSTFKIEDDDAADRLFQNNGTFSGEILFEIDPWDSDIRFSSNTNNKATFENRGNTNNISLGESVCAYSRTQLDNIKSSLTTKNRWNIKNYGTISGDLSLGSIFTLTLVSGSNISGNVSLGENDEWDLCEANDDGSYSNEHGSEALSGKSYLNVVLTADESSTPLISGTLTLGQEADLTVSSESTSMKQSVKIYDTLEGDYSLPISGTFTNGGDTFSWTLNLETGVLSVESSKFEEEVTITDESGTLTATTAGTYVTFDSAVTNFSGKISGEGEVAIDHDITLSGDLSKHSGQLSVGAGKTLTVKDTAALGSGKIDIANDGEIQIAGGTRTLSQDISGSGTLTATNNASIELAGSVSVHNIGIAEDSTLSGSANLHQTNLELAGTLALDAASGESVSLTAGSVVCKSTATLSLTKTDADSSASPASVQLLDANDTSDATDALIAKLKAGERVTVFSGTGTVSFEDEDGAEKFLKTDKTLSSLATDNIILYRNTGTELSAILVSDFSEVIDNIPAPDGLDTAFRDALVDKDAITKAVGTNRFVDESSIAGDPLVVAALAGDTATAQKIVRNASPLGYAAMLAAPISAFYNDARSVSARLAQRRADNSSAQKTTDNSWEFFAQAQGSSVENDDASDAPAFDFDTYGVFVGADFSVNKTLTAGIALGYETGSADIHDDGGDIDLSDFRLVAFLGKSFENNIFVNAGVHAGYGDYDATRKSAYGESSGDTTGWNAGVFADAGIRFDFEHGLSVAPYVGLAFAHAEVGSFDETGGKALGLDSFSGESLRARIGCAGTWDFLIAETDASLGLDIAFSHDFLGDEADIDYSLGGKSFTATAQLLPENTISVSPSLGVALTESTRVYAAYTFAAGTDSAISHSANVGFSYRF